MNKSTLFLNVTFTWIECYYHWLMLWYVTLWYSDKKSLQRFKHELKDNNCPRERKEKMLAPNPPQWFMKLLKCNSIVDYNIWLEWCLWDMVYSTLLYGSYIKRCNILFCTGHLSNCNSTIQYESLCCGLCCLTIKQKWIMSVCCIKVHTIEVL